MIDSFLEGRASEWDEKQNKSSRKKQQRAIRHLFTSSAFTLWRVSGTRRRRRRPQKAAGGGRHWLVPFILCAERLPKRSPTLGQFFFKKKKYFLFLKNKMRHPKTSQQPVVFHQVWQEAESISRLDVNGLFNNRFITCQFLASSGLWHPFLDLFDRFIKPVVIQTDGHQDASQMDDHRKLCSNPVAGTCTGYLTELNNFPLKFNFNENSFRTKPPHFGSFSPGTHKLCSFSRVSVDGLQCGGVDLSMSCQWPPVLSPTAALPKWLCFGHFIPRHYLHIYHTHRHPESAVGCLFSTQFF